MTDRLSYHKPAPQDEPVIRRRRAQRALWIGLAIVCLSLLLVLSPLLLGRSMVNKFIVTFGLLGVCWGISCLLHAGWDWIRK